MQPNMPPPADPGLTPAPQAPMAPAAAAPGAPVSPGPEPGSAPPLGPEEAKMADAIVTKASELYPEMTKALGKSHDPVSTAGELSGKVFHQVLKKFNSEGIQIPKGVSQAVSMEILDDMLDIAEQKGLISPASDDDRQGIYMQALSELGKGYAQSEGIARRNGQEAKGLEQQYLAQQQQQQPAPEQAPAPAVPQGTADIQPEIGGYI